MENKADEAFWEKQHESLGIDAGEVIKFGIDDIESFCAIEGDLPTTGLIDDIYRWANDFNEDKHLYLYRACLAGNFAGLAIGLGYFDAAEYCDIALELLWLSNFYFQRACDEQN